MEDPEIPPVWSNVVGDHLCKGIEAGSFRRGRDESVAKGGRKAVTDTNEEMKAWLV